MNVALFIPIMIALANADLLIRTVGFYLGFPYISLYKEVFLGLELWLLLMLAVFSSRRITIDRKHVPAFLVLGVMVAYSMTIGFAVRGLTLTFWELKASFFDLLLVFMILVFLTKNKTAALKKTMHNLMLATVIVQVAVSILQITLRYRFFDMMLIPMNEEIAKFEGQGVLDFFRPMGFFREGALLGLYGVFAFIWFYGNKGDKYLEKYGRLGCVLSFILVFLSTSRSSILAILSLIAVSFVSSRLKGDGRKPRYALSFFLLMLVSNMFLVLFKIFDLLKQIIPRFDSYSYTLLDIYSLSMRLFLWEYFYEVFAAYDFVYKMLGNGLGAMGASTASSMSTTAIYMVGDNAYLWLVFNCGIIGLLLWLGLNLFMYVKGSQKMKNMIIALAAFGNFSVFFESYIFQLLFPVFIFIFFVSEAGSSRTLSVRGKAE